MAFTKKEIEEAIKKSVGDFGIEPDMKYFEANINYPVIMDYLTGVTSSLQHLQQDYAYIWHPLINLLKSIEPPSTDDELVMNVMRHPTLSQLSGYLSSWLVNYALSNPNERSFKAVLTQLMKSGLNDADMFDLFINVVNKNNRRSPQEIEGTPLRTFLINHIKRATRLNSPGSHWNQLFFSLLEDANPKTAGSYLLQRLGTENPDIASMFITYKNGAYLPLIVSHLRNSSDNININIIRDKLYTAIRLYESDASRYEDLLPPLCRDYLQRSSAEHTRWEVGILSDAFEEFKSSQMPYTSASYFFLFRNDKNEACKFLGELVEKKTYVSEKTLSIALKYLGADAYSYIEKVVKTDYAGVEHQRSLFNLLLTHFEPSAYLPLIWSMGGNKSRPMRELVAQTVASLDPEAEAKAISLLDHKTADARQTGALVLKLLSTSTAAEAMLRTLDKDSNDNARDVLLQAAENFLPKEPGRAFIDNMVKAAADRGKLKKPLEDWLDETQLSALYDKQGNVLPADWVRFLLYRMSRVKTMRSDIEARYIIAQLDKEKAAPFAMELISLFADKGGKPEHKYLLAVAALLGNDSLVDKIRITTNKWIDEGRYKMAEHGVSALALQGSDRALRWVEWYSRKYRSKKANVGAAALAALEVAAEELGITIHELGDKVVPDFGFEGLFKHFTIGNEQFRAFIDSNFKIAFFNEDDKKLKSLPAGADAELKEEFKAIGKEVRDIVKSQSSRLEYYLIIQRRWTYLQWQKFFLQNPVMFIYATKILWGVYDGNGDLQQTFLCNEDTSLVNAAQEEIALDESALIGIVHPIQLEPSLLQQWKQLFFDQSIETIFPQLDRKLPDLSDIDLDKPFITKYEGRQMAQGSIRSTLERYGWHKGGTGDGGSLESMNLLYAEKQLEAVMQLDGVAVGYGWGGDEKLGRLYIIDKAKVKERGWIGFLQKEDDDRLVKPKELPEIFLNEMFAAIEAIKPFEKPVTQPSQ
jgi:hypothetical protein